MSLEGTINFLQVRKEERKSYQEDRIMESTQLERQHKYRLKNKSNIRDSLWVITMFALYAIYI